MNIGGRARKREPGEKELSPLERRLAEVAAENARREAAYKARQRRGGREVTEGERMWAWLMWRCGRRNSPRVEGDDD